MLISVQVHGVYSEIHSYSYRAQALVEKAKFANMRPSVYVQQYPVARFSLTLFYGALKKKKQFAISTICQCCLHTKQHTHLCSAAAPLQSHSEREWADAVSSISELQRAAVCVSENLHQRNLNHISTLTVWLLTDNTHSVGTAAVVVWRFQFFLSFLNYACHKQQAPLRTEIFQWSHSPSLIPDTNSRSLISRQGIGGCSMWQI